MKTVLHEQPRETLEEFADKHGLVMEVTERTRDMRDLGAPRYFAWFQDSAIDENNSTYWVYGNGSTPEEATADYARKISGKLLVINAFLTNHREIQCPEFV